LCASDLSEQLSHLEREEGLGEEIMVDEWMKRKVVVKLIDTSLWVGKRA
jgi:hypothetical protein